MVKAILVPSERHSRFIHDVFSSGSLQYDGDLRAEVAVCQQFESLAGFSAPLWDLFSLSNGGIFFAPRPDEDQEQLILHSPNSRVETVSFQAAGAVATLFVYSQLHSLNRSTSAVADIFGPHFNPTEHFRLLYDYASNSSEARKILALID